jgi:hypothetical protein
MYPTVSTFINSFWYTFDFTIHDNNDSSNISPFYTSKQICRDRTRPPFVGVSVRLLKRTTEPPFVVLLAEEGSSGAIFLAF